MGNDFWYRRICFSRFSIYVFFRAILLTTFLGLSACKSLLPGGDQPVKVGQHVEGVKPALLHVPYALEVLKVDGQSVGTFLSGSAVTLALPPGERILSVRYRNLWETEGGNHHVLKSESVNIRVQLNVGDPYSLVNPPQFRSAEAAKSYVKTFKPELVQAGQSVMLTIVPPQAVGTTMPKSTKAESETTEVQHGLAGLSSRNNNLPSAEEVASSQMPIVESMKVLWHQLDQQERDVFQNWFVKEVQLNMLGEVHLPIKQ